MSAVDWVEVSNPSYTAALAAGIAVGSTVVVIYQIPLLYRTEASKREVTMTAMNTYNFTVTGQTGVQGTHTWDQLYGYVQA